MAKHIPVVAILMIVQGALESLYGLLMSAMGPAFIYLNSNTPSGSASAPSPGLLAGVYLAMGLPMLAAGVLKIVAGSRNLGYRARITGIVALFSGLLSFMGCYCLPTALALMVFGLIVYFAEDSTRAFALGEQGLDSFQIKQKLEQPEPTSVFENRFGSGRS